MRVAIIGAGSWGTAFAALAAHRGPVRLWARRPEQAAAISARRSNPDYLSELVLPDQVEATADLTEAVAGADLIALAVPSHGVRAIAAELPPTVEGVPIISLVKGIEEGTWMRPTEVVADVLGTGSALGVLTGPNLASEIATGHPAAAVLAMSDEALAAVIQARLLTPRFRVYRNVDVVGSEIAGAAKNVMAIAAGIADGLDYGHNALAALTTRALAEVTRLGMSLGGDRHTFAGLAGVGDLMVTCLSPASRNHRVGVELGRGHTLAEAVAGLGMVAEGVRTTAGVLALAGRTGIEMPIAERVGRVLYEGADPAELVAELMQREAKSEDHGMP